MLKIKIGNPVDANQNIIGVLDLFEAWEEAKIHEEEWKAKRQEVEMQLSLIYNDAPPDGQKTHRVDNYKLTRTNRLNYSGDIQKLQQLMNELQLPMLLKYALWDSAIKKLAKEDSTSFEILLSEGALKVSQGTPKFEISHIG